MPYWLTIACPLFVSMAAAILGWWKFYLERRDKRLAEQRQADAERARTASDAELAAIRRRSLADAPYFYLSETLRAHIELRGPEPGRLSILETRFGGVLHACFVDVGPNHGVETPVCLLVENLGSDAVEMTASIEDAPILMQRAANEGVGKLYVFSYPFNAAHHRQVQTISISFLGATGIRDTHRYETKHGVRWLRRIDPA